MSFGYPQAIPDRQSGKVGRPRLLDLKAPPVLQLGSLAEYGQAFREVFVEAVRCRLRSTHPVGSTLSGGLDSSSVVCTTRELLAGEMKQPLHTISLVDADESRCGETPFIREVLRGGWVIPSYRSLRSGLTPDRADGGSRRALRDRGLLPQLVRLCCCLIRRGFACCWTEIRETTSRRLTLTWPHCCGPCNGIPCVRNCPSAQQNLAAPLGRSCVGLFWLGYAEAIFEMWRRLPGGSGTLSKGLDHQP